MPGDKIEIPSHAVKKARKLHQHMNGLDSNAVSKNTDEFYGDTFKLEGEEITGVSMFSDGAVGFFSDDGLVMRVPNSVIRKTGTGYT